MREKAKHCFNLFMFNRLKPLEHPAVRNQKSPHGNECTGYLNTHGNGPITTQDACKCRHALLRKGIGQSPAKMLARRYRRLRYQGFHLGISELKHEVQGEAGRVTFYLFAEADGFYLIEFGQVAIQHDLRIPDEKDTRAYRSRSNRY